MAQPLATYSEKQPAIRRSFELFADRIVVKGTKSGMLFEHPVILTDLRPEPNKMWRRHRHFVIGATMLGLCPIPLLVCAIMPSLDAQRRVIILLLLFGMALLVVGLWICLRTYRMVEFTRFQNQHGLVALDVGDTGPERENYAAFVEALIRAIEASQKKD